MNIFIFKRHFLFQWNIIILQIFNLMMQFWNIFINNIFLYLFFKSYGHFLWESRLVCFRCAQNPRRFFLDFVAHRLSPARPIFLTENFHPHFGLADLRDYSDLDYNLIHFDIYSINKFIIDRTVNLPAKAWSLSLISSWSCFFKSLIALFACSRRLWFFCSSFSFSCNSTFCWITDCQSWPPF